MAPSREYLEEVWQLAKKTLPGWAYATLHSQARASAGGRSAHKTDVPSPLEKLGISKLTPKAVALLEDDELQDIWGRMNGLFKSAVKKKADTVDLLKRARIMHSEFGSRELKLKSSVLLSAIEESKEDVKKSSLLLPAGPVCADIAFVTTCPSQQEALENSFLVGEDREVFVEKYLKPLGLAPVEVFTMSLIPEPLEDDGLVDPEQIEKWLPWAKAELDSAGPEIIIALGKVAKSALGSRANFALPHPKALVRFNDSGEVERKMRRIIKALDKTAVGTENKNTFPEPSDVDGGQKIAERKCENEINAVSLEAQILKADTAKQIVYGVVMDPYGPNGPQPDAHKDFLPPAMIEEAAHAFLQGDRQVGRQHQTKANSVVVESWIEMYPSPDEYKKALAGSPHKVGRRKFGNDVVHSGSWILGVKLGSADWKSYLDGDFNAFSPGGVGLRTPISETEMPKVTFVDLVEK